MKREKNYTIIKMMQTNNVVQDEDCTYICLEFMYIRLGDNNDIHVWHTFRLIFRHT